MTRTVPRPGPIYALADAATVCPGGDDPSVMEAMAEVVGRLARAGVDWIQIRVKPRPPAPPVSDDALIRIVEVCCRATEGTDARLWIDDRADLAALFPVFGLHLGQTDLPPSAARRVVGDAVRIGLSTHDLDQVAAAEADRDVDVVAFGPVFATGSKTRPDAVVGLDAVTGLAAARRVTTKPLVAIGGIDASRISPVLEAGADTAAVISALHRDGTLEQSLERLRRSVPRKERP